MLENISFKNAECLENLFLTFLSILKLSKI